MLLFFFAFLSTDPKGRFLADYPSEVKELRREFAEACGIAIVRSPGDSAVVSPKTFRFAVGPGRRKFEFERPVGKPSGKVSVNGYGYAELDGRNIEVQRSGEKEPYAIRGMGDDDPMRRSIFNSVFGENLNAPWGFVGLDIDDAIARGWLHVTEAREVEVDGKGLVEVTFRQANSPVPSFYRAAFDPALHWAITRGSTYKEDPTKPTERYEATYGPTPSGRVYLKSIHWWEFGGKEKICEFDSVEFKPTPPSEFTLEHYGLKSPPRPKKGLNYFALTGILTLAIALLIAAWFTRKLATR